MFQVKAIDNDLFSVFNFFNFKILFSSTSVTDFLTTLEVTERRVHGLTRLGQIMAVQVQPAVYGFHQSNVLIFL